MVGVGGDAGQPTGRLCGKIALAVHFLGFEKFWRNFN